MFNRIIYKVSAFLRSHGFKDGSATDPRVQKMHAIINRIGGINFKIDFTPSGEWAAESTNVDGIITGGKHYPDEVSDVIRDAVFTYFEIPPHLCNDALIAKQGEVAQVEERVYA